MGKLNLFDTYIIKSKTKNHSLKISIGYQQNSISSVWLDETRITPSDDENEFVRSFKIDLGKGQDLINKEIFINTIVQDISKNTNKTSVKVTITDDKNEYEGVLRCTLTDKKKLVSYIINIMFTN